MFCPTDLQVVQGQEGLGLSSLLLDVLDTVSPRLLRVHDDGVHVLPQHLGDGYLVLLLGGLAQVDQAAVLRWREGQEDEFSKVPLLDAAFGE